MIPYIGRLRCLVACLGSFAILLASQFACTADHPSTAQTAATVSIPFCPATTNLALADETTAISPNSDPTAPLIKDGNPDANDPNPSPPVPATGSWESLGPQWVGLDLGSKLATVNSVELFTGDPSLGPTNHTFTLRDYDIETMADDGVWSGVASVTGNIQYRRLATFTPALHIKKLRIQAKVGGGSGISSNIMVIHELAVNGCVPLPPTMITGRITRFSEGGGPLGQITVDVVGATTQLHASTQTMGDGSYTLTDLPFDTYTVRPSGGGFTFGSAQFQTDHYTVSVSADSLNATVNAVGYRRNPIVYVHGWTDNPGRFQPNPAFPLQDAGYKPYYATLETSLGFTPTLEQNMPRVREQINQAKYETGQPKVIIVAHSMGGLVARTYIESKEYNDDVSQFFTFGTPHLGITSVAHLGCAPNQPGVCEMLGPGISVFNRVYMRRAGVDYHEIGGNSPTWTTRTLFCFKIRIFRKTFKRCVTIPWPDTTFRNPLGWVLGFLIDGPDDGLIPTCSTIGQPGNNIDRFVTQEGHSRTVANRDYFAWNGNHESQQAYDQCLRRVLVDGSTGTCGARSLRVSSCVLSDLPSHPGAITAAVHRLAPSLNAADGDPPSVPAVGQRAAPQSGVLLAGQQMTRTVIVEGGSTTFSVNTQSGSAALSLIDPTGQVIDPAYVADLTDVSPDDPEAEFTNDVPSDAVTYSSSEGTAQYFVPNARPGVWTVTVTGNGDLPAEGSAFTADVGFDSTFLASLRASAPFLTPGSDASFTIQLPPVASTAATMSVTLSSGEVVPLVPVATDDGYTADFHVPSVSGYTRVNWSITGIRNDGVAFERGGVEDVQITSPALTWGGVTAESTTPRSQFPTLVQAVVLQAQVNSSYAGSAMLAADLVSSDGTMVAHVAQALSLAIGTNGVALEFSGDDIYVSGRSGPYTLTNLTIIDMQSAAVVAVSATNTYVTAAYPIGVFASSPGIPSVTTTGPYTMVAGDTLDLVADGVDPEGDPLSFAWDLDGDGTYEASGRVVQYTAPASPPPASLRVGVRVTDPSGNTATATTTIDVLPREVNLSLQSTASASSTLSGYSSSHVNDNDINTALDPNMSWANDSHFDCTVSDDGPVCTLSGSLPATLDVDFGATRTVTHATVYTSALLPIQDYDLSIWDGTGWNVVDRVLGNSELVRNHSFAPTVGSKMRITGYKGPDAQSYLVRVNELQVFGY